MPRALPITLPVFLIAFLAGAWFQHSQPGWNVNSRLALTIALGQFHTFAVDAPLAASPDLETEDLARYNNHLYSDKSIGASLLGTIPYVVIRAVAPPGWPLTHIAALRWILTAATSALCAGLAAVLLMYWLAALDTPAAGLPPPHRLRLPTRRHAWLSLFISLGTMLLPFSSLYMSYLPATVALLATLLLIEQALRRAAPSGIQSTTPPRPRHTHIFLAGLTAGLCILCEYLYGAAVAFAGLYLLARLPRPVGAPLLPRPIITAAALYALGAVIGLLPFLIYTRTTFGQFAIPYQFHFNPQFQLYMSRGFLGATSPSATVLWLITFHPFRGLFFYSPHLLLALGGLIALIARVPTRRPIAILCLTTIAFYLLFNSAYYMWWGGWSFAPRHLAPALVFFAPGLLPLMARRPLRLATCALALIGVAVHLTVAATEPQPPDGGWQAALLHPSLARYDYPATFLADTLPRLRTGQLDQNIGSLLGLSPAARLILLLLLWAALATPLLIPRRNRL